MRNVTMVSSLLLAVLVLGCSEQPAVTEVEQASIGTPLYSANNGWEEFDIPIDAVFFVPCANDEAGEDIHFTGTCTTLEKFVETPSGNVNVNWRPNSCHDYTATGLTTGDVYEPRHDSFGKLNVHHGAGDVIVYREHGSIVNVETGERIDLPYRFHFTVNGNGERTVVMEAESCRLHKN